MVYQDVAERVNADLLVIEEAAAKVSTSLITVVGLEHQIEVGALESSQYIDGPLNEDRSSAVALVTFLERVQAEASDLGWAEVTDWGDHGEVTHGSV